MPPLGVMNVYFSLPIPVRITVLLFGSSSFRLTIVWPTSRSPRTGCSTLWKHDHLPYGSSPLSFSRSTWARKSLTVCAFSLGPVTTTTMPRGFVGTPGFALRRL